MIELVLLACLSGDPNVCKDVPLNISGDMTPQQCLLAAQPEASKWAETNPGWKVARLTCGRVGRYARI